MSSVDRMGIQIESSAIKEAREPAAAGTRPRCHPKRPDAAAIRLAAIGSAIGTTRASGGISRLNLKECLQTLDLGAHPVRPALLLGHLLSGRSRDEVLVLELRFDPVQVLLKGVEALLRHRRIRGGD